MTDIQMDVERKEPYEAPEIIVVELQSSARILQTSDYNYGGFDEEY